MAIITNRRRKAYVAWSLCAPFVICFALFFLWPLVKVVQMSFTNAPLIGGGDWVGLANYERLLHDKLFFTSLKNNGYFVLLTVIPTTVVALSIALMITRLKAPAGLAMVIFFLPYVLPVSVVTDVWVGCSTSSTACCSR
ncbi:MAG: sugar ABC transporter permease [Amaricoccus sp.]